MKYTRILIVFLILTIQISLYAVSGIGVCDYQGEVNSVCAHFIKDNRWKDSIHLVTVDTRLKARSSQINSYGTHCAFLYNDGGWHVAITTIGGVNKTVRRICEVPNDGDVGVGRIWTHLLEWPRGEWIWFTSTKNNNRIYRVHVQNGERQHVANVGPNSNQFQMSGNAKIAIGAGGSDARSIRLPEDPAGGPYDLQTYGWGGACGHGISPSGIYSLANNNGYHSRIAISKVDTNTWDPTQDRSVGMDGNIDNKMWDAWALDSSLGFYVTDDNCDPKPNNYFQLIGGGNSTLQGWSSNSDYWGALVCGFAPEGRDLETGSNIIGINFIREETMPFTRNYAKCDPLNNPDQNEYIAWHGDIWISDPIEDIASGYIDDFNSRDSYTIEGTDTEVDPRVNVLWENVGIKNSMREVNYSNSIDGLRFDPREKSRVRIGIFDARGKLHHTKSIEDQHITVPSSIFKKGVNLIVVKGRTGTIFIDKKFIVE